MHSSALLHVYYVYKMQFLPAEVYGATGYGEP